MRQLTRRRFLTYSQAIPSFLIIPRASQEADRVRQRLRREMVEIPAGSFTMGVDDSLHPTANPAHSVELPAFKIMRRKLRWSDYHPFIKARGRNVPFNERTRSRSWHPEEIMGGLSYADITAFASWIGLDVPTEHEWEKAARGTDGRRFPWGNEPLDHSLRRYSEKDLASPFDVRETTQPFWTEWTCSIPVPYPGYDLSEFPESGVFTCESSCRVVRGGTGARNYGIFYRFWRKENEPGRYSSARLVER